jgi:hypothetical protein
MLWFGFAFPPEVESMVMSPGSYTKLSVYYQAVLRSGASLALYEICRRYATNPTKVTNRSDWEWWYGALTGNPVTDAIPEYKYFKRDVVKPAIAEINLITDINVELIEHKQGRRVAELQFKVVPAQQESLRLPAPPLIDSELLQRITALGISHDEACNILAMTEDGKLRATLELTEKRVANPNASRVDNPAGYFKQALREGFASTVDIAKKNVRKIAQKPSVEASIESIREQYFIERAKDALGLFNEMTEEERTEWLSKFKQSAGSKGINLARGLSTPSVKSAFSMWFAQEQWDEPTDSDLLRFAAVKSVQNK